MRVNRMSTRMTTDWERTRPPLKRITSPAAPGNTLAVKHGAGSEHRWRPIANDLIAELLAERPWLAQHRRSVEAWARVTAQVELISSWLDEVGLLDAAGEPRKACDRLDRLESRAQSLRADLAETPMAMARLLGTLTSTAATAGASDTLAALDAEGRAWVARWELSKATTTELPPRRLQAAVPPAGELEGGR